MGTISLEGIIVANYIKKDWSYKIIVIILQLVTRALVLKKS